ncbi:hypothetical protein [Sulfurimonas marina]|uniref:JHP0747 family n=1 Tax=Sulfurimonas marina TaxID=2590551 RepID=A0A7M1ATP2_9BACT|nr:hypothetical protein [Sulfurimonas marina]QOP40784.1 hypothetical protein FJR03_03115 [Sulfurimonas marina]
MRVAVECSSPLLQKSLELFLGTYLDSSKKSDIVIRDTKCLNDPKCFYIANNEEADLLKPFSKSQLILALEKRYESLHPKKEQPTSQEESFEDEGMDFSVLEKRIEFLTNEYKENVLRAVKAFYEK